MVSAQSLSLPFFTGVSGIFDVPKKTAIIRLRWPVVIICSYLLLYSSPGSFVPGAVYALLLYLLSNAALYLVDEKLFSSPYFYAPLVIFDTLFITASVAFSGQVSPEFYLFYFLTIILCSLCRDFRALVIVALLAPLVHGYFLLKSTEVYDPSVYLRLPLPFVISLFYGYFAQLENFEKSLKEKAEQETQNMAMIYSLSQALTRSLDSRQILRSLRDKVTQVLPAAKLYVFVVEEGKGASRALLFDVAREEALAPREVFLQDFSIVAECLAGGEPVFRGSAQLLPLRDDDRGDQAGFFFAGAMAIPIAFRGEKYGAILLGFEEGKLSLSEREHEYGKIVAFATAIALSQARREEQLERANRVKSQFLSVMSHELRTPLNVVMGYTGMIQDRILGEINEEQEKVLGKVVKQSRDLLSMISSILEVTMLEAQMVKLEKQEVEMSEILDELRLAYDLRLDKDLIVIWDYPPELPTLRTDSSKLGHILKNLIDNAIKFTENGSVTISAWYYPATRTIEVKVADTGIGVSQEALPVIFDRFRQVDSSETRAYGGVGLGLYIVKRFTELLGGKITVESELGKGSIFTLTLPYGSN